MLKKTSLFCSMILIFQIVGCGQSPQALVQDSIYKDHDATYFGFSVERSFTKNKRRAHSGDYIWTDSFALRIHLCDSGVSEIPITCTKTGPVILSLKTKATHNSYENNIHVKKAMGKSKFDTRISQLKIYTTMHANHPSLLSLQFSETQRKFFDSYVYNLREWQAYNKKFPSNPFYKQYFRSRDLRSHIANQMESRKILEEEQAKIKKLIDFGSENGDLKLRLKAIENELAVIQGKIDSASLEQEGLGPALEAYRKFENETSKMERELAKASSKVEMDLDWVGLSKLLVVNPDLYRPNEYSGEVAWLIGADGKIVYMGHPNDVVRINFESDLYIRYLQLAQIVVEYAKLEYTKTQPPGK